MVDEDAVSAADRVRIRVRNPQDFAAGLLFMGLARRSRCGSRGTIRSAPRCA